MVQISKKVFVAADVFFAFIDRAHPKHEQASAYFRYFGENEYHIYTDFINILTIYSQIFLDISPTLAKDFLRTISLSNINVIYPEESDTKAALKTLLSYQSNELTYAKALMAVLASKRNIYAVCTFEYLLPLFGQQVFYLPI